MKLLNSGYPEYKDGEKIVDSMINYSDKIQNSNFTMFRYGSEGSPYLIPEGHEFVIGDNFRNSSDSREKGSVPVDSIVRKQSKYIGN